MYIIHAQWFYDKFSVDLLDLGLKHTVLGVLGLSARNFWRKKFSREQIFTSWRLIAKITKISRYTVFKVKDLVAKQHPTNTQTHTFHWLRAAQSSLNSLNPILPL